MKNIKSLLFVTVTTLLLAITTASAAMTQRKISFSRAQVQDIETIVHNYLVKNPTVLVEASQALQVQQMAQMQKSAIAAIIKNKQQLFRDPGTPIAGNKNGTIKLVEFFDYQCGHCRQMAAIVDNIIKANTNIKLILKDWPIFGGVSKFAAQASIAAYLQSPKKFYRFHDAIYNANPPLTTDVVLKLAKQSGLNTKQLVATMKSKAIAQQLKDNFTLSQALGLQGTPAFVISNNSETKFKFIPGATSQKSLQNSINALK